SSGVPVESAGMRLDATKLIAATIRLMAAAANVAIVTSNLGSKKNPASRQPTTAPPVLMPYSTPHHDTPRGVDFAHRPIAGSDAHLNIVGGRGPTTQTKPRKSMPGIPNCAPATYARSIRGIRTSSIAPQTAMPASIPPYSTSGFLALGPSPGKTRGKSQLPR